MSVIRLLDDHLISQIAAGEVVERPASVVKELVENALDAGARDLRIELLAGGKRLIAISDDGCGMDADDALLAFDRHATSKIASFEDLEQVATLGFRGEALASIAAVARVELRTAKTPGDGHRVSIEGGRVKTVEPVSYPRGTRIEVASLFFNVPARRKFLKRPQVELRQVIAVLQGYAIALPEVRFHVEHEGRTLLEALPATPDEEGLRNRIGQVFGKVLEKNLEPISGGPAPLATGADEPDEPDDPARAPRESIAGFVGRPDTTRGRRLFVYVNRRLIRDRAILAVFYRAVRDIWKSEETPALFLFLTVPAHDVDVNVHPQKAEVRFRDPSFLSRIEAALRDALARARGEEEAPFDTPSHLPDVPAVWEGLGGRKTRLEVDEAGHWQAVPADSEVAEGGARPYDGTALGPPPHAAQASMARPAFVPPAPRVVPLSGRSGEARPFRLLGQYKGSLVLLEGPDGLYLIDQHVAHERILFERLRRAFEQEAQAGQRLLEPPLLELGPAESMRLQEMTPGLAACGFELTALSGGAIALQAVPTELTAEAAERLLVELATSDRPVENEPGALRQRLLDELAAERSCKAAVKMHHPMAIDAMEAMITELFQCEHPYACPHGRPVVLRMTDTELERRFGRR